MRRVLLVAFREFSATVMTKGFLLGMLFTPALMALLVFVMPRMMNRAAPKVEGEVALVDPSGRLHEKLAAHLTPQRFAERRNRMQQQVEAATSVVRRQIPASPAGDAAMKQAVAQALGEVPRLTVTALAADVDIEQAKAPLRAALSRQYPDPRARLVLIVVHPDAVRRADGRTAFGSYDLFVRGKLDDRLVDDVQAGMREAIVSARLEESGLDAAQIRELSSVARPTTRAVTVEGERASNAAFNIMIPMGFMMLLMMSVMTSGQNLLVTMVEEKSNRVVEVLLSALSAMELMTGKILGQMAVGLLVLALYAGLGLVALVSFALIGLLDPLMIAYLLVFYLLAALMYSALLAAVGAAVNDMREAGTLMMPVMMLMIVPWVLWFPISRDPNSVMAIVLSYLPPINCFVMLLRMASSTPPPLWQTLSAIAVAALGVLGSLWFAAKVFRIGLLMFGKPPTFGTLIKWARMA